MLLIRNKHFCWHKISQEGYEKVFIMKDEWSNFSTSQHFIKDSKRFWPCQQVKLICQRSKTLRCLRCVLWMLIDFFFKFFFHLITGATWSSKAVRTRKIASATKTSRRTKTTRRITTTSWATKTERDRTTEASWTSKTERVRKTGKDFYDTVKLGNLDLPKKMKSSKRTL